VLLAIRLERPRGLAPRLEGADHQKDLQLRRRRHRIPLVARATGRRDVGEADGGDVDVRKGRLEVPSPVHAVELEDEADEAGHRNAAVLDLGVAEPRDQLRRRRRKSERGEEKVRCAAIMRGERKG